MPLCVSVNFAVATFLLKSQVFLHKIIFFCLDKFANATFFDGTLAPTRNCLFVCRNVTRGARQKKNRLIAKTSWLSKPYNKEKLEPFRKMKRSM